MRLLREHWPWIVVPLVLVLAALAVLLWLGRGDGGASPFDYPVF